MTRPPWPDMALAGVLAAAVLLEHLLPRDPVSAPVAVSLVAVLPVAWRRTAPLAALTWGAVLVLGPAVLLHVVPPFFGNDLALYVLVYSAARYDDGRVARLLWASGPVAFLALGVAAPGDFDLADLVFETLVCGVAWLAGRTVHRYEDQGRRLSETLSALAVEQAERQRSAVAAERSRIAAEMHDVVAHSVSLVVVQVGATRIRLERDGVPRPGLAAVEDAGREALSELRRMLGVLREGQG